MGLKKYNEFVKLTDTALSDELHSSKVRLSEMRFEHKVKGLSNPSVISHLRKEIAQMSTELTKRNKN